MDPSILLSSIDHANPTIPHLGSIKNRLNEIIEYSTVMLDKRSSVIMRELEGLKKEYLSQLQKLNQYFSNDKLNASASNATNSSFLKTNKSKSPIASQMKMPSKLSSRSKTNQKNLTPTSQDNIVAQKIVLNKNASTRNVSQVRNLTKKNISMTIVNKDSAVSKTLLSLNKKEAKKTSLESNNSLVSTNNNTVKRRPSPLTPNLSSHNIQVDNISSISNNNSAKNKKRLTYPKHNRTKSGPVIKEEKEKKTVITKNPASRENSIKKNLQSSNIKDERKFSILDIAGSSVNLLENIQKELNEEKKIQFDYNFRKLKGINDRKIMALYTLTISGMLPLKQRILITSFNKQIREHLHPKDLIQEYSSNLDNKISAIQQDMINNGIDREQLIKKVVPSKTAQNVLNFISKDCEKSLQDSCEVPEIVNTCKLIYVLLKENIPESIPASSDNLTNTNIVSNLFNNIMPKYGIANLKLLFLHVIYNIVYVNHSLSRSQLVTIKELVIQTPNLIQPSEMVKICAPVSYLTFSLKEIYDYITEKSSDTGEDLFYWRVKLKEMKKLQKEQEKLHRFVK